MDGDDAVHNNHGTDESMYVVSTFCNILYLCVLWTTQSDMNTQIGAVGQIRYFEQQCVNE